MSTVLSNLGLPGQLLNLLPGAGARNATKSTTPSSKTSSASNASSGTDAASFAGVLNGALANAATDPVAQLTALVKDGTPITTIIDRLSNQIADAVQKRLPASQLGSGASRTALVNSIKTALSPPSNAPPGTAAQQVAALEQRLQRWLEGLSGGADQQAGQQSDISGKILDANSARELPAQTQSPKSTPASTGALSLSRALLKSVAAALTAGSLPAAKPTATAAVRTPSAGKAESTAAHTTSAKAPVAIARIPTPVTTGDPSPVDDTGLPAPVPASPAAASAPNPAAAPAVAAPAVAAAPSAAQAPADLVARMLIRAAGVDAVHNDLATVQTVPSAQLARGSTPAGTLATPVASPEATTAKMTMLLTQAISAAAEASGENASVQDDALRDQAQNQNQDANAASAAAPVATKATAASDFSAFSLPSVTTPVTTAQSLDLTAAAATSVPVDQTATIEQLVKSMAMRTGSDGTSEMRMRLQPESLGTVTLKLTVDGNNVSANVVAQNGEARTALLASQHQLARSLADSGLKLTSFTVDVSGGQAQDQKDRTSGFGRRYAVHEVAAPDGESQEGSSVGPELLSGSTLGLLSYLA
jgi:hypothetical protein